MSKITASHFTQFMNAYIHFMYSCYDTISIFNVVIDRFGKNEVKRGKNCVIAPDRGVDIHNFLDLFEYFIRIRSFVNAMMYMYMYMYIM